MVGTVLGGRVCFRFRGRVTWGGLGVCLKSALLVGDGVSLNVAEAFGVLLLLGYLVCCVCLAYDFGG